MNQSTETEKHLNRENEKEKTTRDEFLNTVGIQDEYFEPAPKVLTPEEHAMAEQIKQWILMERDSIKVCERLLLKTKILNPDDEFGLKHYPSEIEKHKANIKKFEAKLKELGV